VYRRELALYIEKRKLSTRDFYKEFESTIRKIANRHHVQKVFSDFCEMSALAIANALQFREDREEQYMRLVGQYEKDEPNKIASLLAITVDALEWEMQDSLGTVFSRLDLAGNNGQFFTPYSVSRMMARTNIEIDDFKPSKFLTLLEPACGAGSMVIAVAEHLAGNKINYQKQLCVTAIDVNSTAAHMAYIQLSLLGIPAIVYIGNTLSNEIRDEFFTPVYALYMHRFQEPRGTKQ